MILAPRRADAYAQLAALHSYTDDLEGLRAVWTRLKGVELDLRGGIKGLDGRGWAQVLPDPDEPLIHVYAEGESDEVSEELEAELHRLVDEIMQQQEAGAEAPISS